MEGNRKQQSFMAFASVLAYRLLLLVPAFASTSDGVWRGSCKKKINTLFPELLVRFPN